MENQVVRRRANVIAAHLASPEDISATATHVFPMVCSNTLNSVIRRYDNRTNFARQATGSQGCYMRQASTEQMVCTNTLNSVIRRYDNRTNFARQATGSQGCYMRQASTEQMEKYTQPGVLSKSTSCGNKGSKALEAPSFSRPAQIEPGIPTVRGIQSVVQGCKYTNAAPEGPMFAKPNQASGQPKSHSEEKARNVAPKGFEWSPRMDVVESGFNYTVTIEIPGVNIDNIKVEVHDQSLIIKGNRSNWSYGSAYSNESGTSYHRREILQGPYRIVWPLPSNANKENISAEIQDGLLRITIPKLLGLRWLRKAYM